jgi:adenosine/AMP kinase
MQLMTVPIEKPRTTSFILGQARFIVVLGNGLRAKDREGEEDIRWCKDLLRRRGYRR